MSTYLPVETLDAIFKHALRQDLTQIVRVNRLWHDVALRILYHTVPGLGETESLNLLLSLAESEYKASLVRKIRINWQEYSLKDPAFSKKARLLPLKKAKGKQLWKALIASVFGRRSKKQTKLTVLNKSLRNLVNLTHLTLHLSSYDSMGVDAADNILGGCTFKLATFVTSLICNGALMQFLDGQPTIRNLNLMAHTKSDPSTIIKPTTLPNLHAFGWAQRDATDVVTQLLVGRPVQRVGTILNANTVNPVLEMIGQSGCVVQYASFSFRTLDTDPFPRFASELPALRRLKLVTFQLPSKTILESMARSISDFKCLQSVELGFRPDSMEVDMQYVKHMFETVSRWFTACPNITHVDFPASGKRLQRPSPRSSFSSTISGASFESTQDQEEEAAEDENMKDCPLLA